MQSEMNDFKSVCNTWVDKLSRMIVYLHNNRVVNDNEDNLFPEVEHLQNLQNLFFFLKTPPKNMSTEKFANAAKDILPKVDALLAMFQDNTCSLPETMLFSSYFFDAYISSIQNSILTDINVIVYKIWYETGRKNSILVIQKLLYYVLGEVKGCIKAEDLSEGDNSERPLISPIRPILIQSGMYKAVFLDQDKIDSLDKRFGPYFSMVAKIGSLYNFRESIIYKPVFKEYTYLNKCKGSEIVAFRREEESLANDMLIEYIRERAGKVSRDHNQKLYALVRYSTSAKNAFTVHVCKDQKIRIFRIMNSPFGYYSCTEPKKLYSTISELIFSSKY